MNVCLHELLFINLLVKNKNFDRCNVLKKDNTNMLNDSASEEVRLETHKKIKKHICVIILSIRANKRHNKKI